MITVQLSQTQQGYRLDRDRGITRERPYTNALKSDFGEHLTTDQRKGVLILQGKTSLAKLC